MICVDAWKQAITYETGKSRGIAITENKDFAREEVVEIEKISERPLKFKGSNPLCGKNGQEA